jgi:hypothetical protein
VNRRGESIPREKGEISLDKLFEPKTVALVGSSKLADRVGMMNPRVFDSVYHNLMKFFRGKTMKFDIGEDVSQFREGSVKADLAVITL